MNVYNFKFFKLHQLISWQIALIVLHNTFLNFYGVILEILAKHLDNHDGGIDINVYEVLYIIFHNLTVEIVNMYKICYIITNLYAFKV